MKKFFSLIALFACAISGWAQRDLAAAIAQYPDGGNVTYVISGDDDFVLNSPLVIPRGLNLTIDARNATNLILGEEGTFVSKGNLTLIGLTIDASKTKKAIFNIATEYTAEDSTACYNESIGRMVLKGGFTIRNCEINNVPSYLYNDNGKNVVVNNFTIENSIIKFNTSDNNVKSNALISAKGYGFNNLEVSSSTLYNVGSIGAKYFVQYNNSARADRGGIEQTTVTLNNNTFYNTIDAGGQFANWNGMKDYTAFTTQNNIFFGIKDVARRLVGGNASSKSTFVWNKNTYAWPDGENVGFDNESNYDKTGTAIKADPMYRFANEGNFTLNKYSEQAKYQTGDPRWRVEYDDAFEEIEEDFENFQDMRKTFTDALGTTLDQLAETYPEVAKALTALDESLKSLPAEIQAGKKNEDPSVGAKVNALEGAFAALTGALEATPYGDVVKGLYSLSLQYLGIMEEYGDTLSALRLTELSSRVKDEINREFLILAQDLQLHPKDPSNLRLNFHRTRVLLIAASIRTLEEAIDFQLSREGRLKAIVDAISNIIRGKDDVYKAHSAVIVADDELQTEWNNLCSRIDVENVAINALDAETASTEEISAHEVELSDITDKLEAFAAKLAEGEATAIESATAAKNANGVIYNMAGQKVDANYRGIVIINGKKVIK